LRAFLAVGFAKHGWTAPQTVPEMGIALIHALASAPPMYRLPAGGVAHTRHYLPITEGKIQKTTKVLDTFLRFADGDQDDQALFIHWPVTLPDAQRDLLAHLVADLPYLGRAEAWVEARLIDSDPPDDQWAMPVAEGEPVDPGWEQVAVLAPVSAAFYADWRQTRTSSPPISETKNKPAKAKKGANDDLYPADLLACLCADTATLQKQGWSQPPGSRRVLYRRPVGCMEPAVPVPHRIASRRAPVECALLALSADTKSGTLLPLMTRCLPQAEHLHAAWIKQLGPNAINAAVSGRAGDGAPLANNHQHAHLIPLDLDENGRMDHVLVWARGKLGEAAQQALLRLHRTWGKGLPDIVVTCAGMGSREEVIRQLRDRRDRLPPILGLQANGKARVWTSVTPFIAPRFLKRPGSNNGWDGQIRAECRSRDLPDPVTVEDLGRSAMMERNFLRFIRARRDGHPQPPSTAPWCLRLTFPEPVSGPIALGYGSHFGLGLFAAES